MNDHKKERKLYNLVIDSLEKDGAENIQTIDLEGQASFADYMIIATGFSERQLSAMANNLQLKLKESKNSFLSIEGEGTEWVLLDEGDFIVHILTQESRQFYGLEDIWNPKLNEDIEEDIIIHS